MELDAQELTPEFSEEGERRYDALVRSAAGAVVGLDFDGTLSPIVEDPTRAHIHPDAAQALIDLAGRVRAVAVITGRPARQVLDLGGLEEVGTAIGTAGKELFVFGQYGNERWSSTNRRVIGPRPPAGLATFMRELAPLLRGAGAGDAHVEEKGLAVAVHTRRMADPAGAVEMLLPPLRDLAARHDLTVEPGRHVVEVRSPGMHKGVVVERFAAETGAAAFCFCGDDLGDVEAFEAVTRLSENGLATLLVCSASEEQNALRPLADVVVPGPDGVVAFLRRLAHDVEAIGS